MTRRRPQLRALEMDWNRDMKVQRARLVMLDDNGVWEPLSPSSGSVATPIRIQTITQSTRTVSDYTEIPSSQVTLP